MIRTICAMMVIAGCYLIGRKAAKDLGERLFFIKDFIYCLNQMKIRLEFDIPPCSELLTETRQRAKSEDVKSLFLHVICGLESHLDMEKAWEKAAADLEKNISYFKNEEKTAILRFGSLLGSSHKQGQLAGLDSTIAELEQIQSEITQVYASKTKFYKSIGAIVGIMLAIVII